jgi:hypothetical protein
MSDTSDDEAVIPFDTGQLDQKRRGALFKGPFGHEVLVFFVSILAVTPLLLIPFIYATYTSGFKKVLSLKFLRAFDQELYMLGFGRLSLFLGICSLSLAVCRFAPYLIPLGVLLYTKHLSPTAHRRWVCFLHTRRYWSTILFTVSLILALAWNAFDTTLLGIVIDTLSDRLQGKEAKPIETHDSLVFYFERAVISFAILSLMWAVAKYMVCSAKYGFHATTFGKRITDVNARLLQLTQAYLKASGRSLASSADFADDSTVADSPALELTSLGRAKAIAWTTFRSNIIPRHEYPILNTTREEDCVETVVNLYKETRNIKMSLSSNKRIIRKLDTLVTSVATVVGLLLCTPFLDFGFSSLWAGFLALFAALGFALQSVGRTSFEALLFIFVVHSFDIGDTVSIDNEQFVVADLEIFTSVFRKLEDNTLVYAPNSTLSGKNIANITRSQEAIDDLQ